MKAEAAKALNLKKHGISRVQVKEKAVTVGHFVPSKKAVLDDLSGIEPELINEDQKNKQLVDISVIRRGLNYHGANDKDLKKEQEEIKREERLQQREWQMANRVEFKIKEEKEEPDNSKPKEED